MCGHTLIVFSKLEFGLFLYIKINLLYSNISSKRGNIMKNYSIQMIDSHVSSEWWKAIIAHFVKVGDRVEIRCWKEEIEDISHAKHYEKSHRYTGNEVSISAIVTDELVAELMDENPKYKELYNKMTKYFTINVKNDLCDICSTHYGTEMYITIYSDIDISFFEGVMSKFTEDEFSIGEW